MQATAQSYIHVLSEIEIKEIENALKVSSLKAGPTKLGMLTLSHYSRGNP